MPYDLDTCTVTVLLPLEATEEQHDVIEKFATMLVAVTADGGRKRAAGTKPKWDVDTSHWAAMFSHINKRMHGEVVDPDSGMHPFVHLAWRALAIAWQEDVALKALPIETKPKAAPLPEPEPEVSIEDAVRILARCELEPMAELTPHEVAVLRVFLDGREYGD